jgi:hypothetical protein
VLARSAATPRAPEADVVEVTPPTPESLLADEPLVAQGRQPRSPNGFLAAPWRTEAHPLTDLGATASID